MIVLSGQYLAQYNNLIVRKDYDIMDLVAVYVTFISKYIALKVKKHIRIKPLYFSLVKYNTNKWSLRLFTVRCELII